MNKLFPPCVRKRCACLPLMALVLGIAGSAQAAEESIGAPVAAATPPFNSIAAKTPTVAAKSPFAGPTVSQRLLANSRAGSASAVVTETGSLQQTTASNVQTGSNAIGGGSFANALGLTTVIQNSGANVLIQNATTVNVQFK